MNNIAAPPVLGAAGGPGGYSDHVDQALDDLDAATAVSAGSSLYGPVVGDGIADDTNAILAAIAALGVNPGTATLPRNATCRVTRTLALVDHQTLDLNGSTLVGDANSLTIATITGSHAKVCNGFITKAAGRTGVVGLRVNPNSTGSVQCNFNRLDHLRIEGNGPADFMATAIAIVAGVRISGQDIGAWYSRLNDIDIRWCTTGVYLDADPAAILNGANGTVGTGVRCGDCTVGWHTKIGDAHVWGFAAEGCGKGIWIEQNAGADHADNNNSHFGGCRAEANTIDVQVDANCFQNSFQGDFAVAKIVDNGVSTRFYDADGLTQFDGYKWTGSDGIVRLGVQNYGVRIPSAGAFGLLVGSETGVTTTKYGFAKGLIRAENSDWGQALTLVSDSVGRGLLVTSSNWDASINGGSGISVDGSGNIRSVDQAGAVKNVLGLSGTYVRLESSNATPPGGDLTNGSLILWIDEATNNLKVAVKYAGGTAKAGTVCALT